MSTATYVPEFDIAINGQPLSAAVRSHVTGVTLQDGRNAADRVEISLANPNLRWLQEHIRGLGVQPIPTGLAIGPLRADAAPAGTFDIDNKLSLAIGYAPGPLEEVFTGEITGVTCSFPNGGMPGMTIVAHDHLNRMTRGTYAGGFGFLPDMLVAMILGARNLLIPLIDPAVMAASTAMAVINAIFTGAGPRQGAPGQGETDFAFLRRIAAQYDADFWAEGDVLYVSRFIKEYSPRLSLRWGESLLDFSPRMSAVGQVAGVSMKFTLREIPLDFLVTVAWDFDRESLSVSIVPGVAAAGAAAVSGPSLTIIDRPISSPADIAASAVVILHELRKKLNQRLTASGSAIGNPQIRAGALISIEGLGPDFSRNYRVSSVTHTLGTGGWQTDFDAFVEIIP